MIAVAIYLVSLALLFSTSMQGSYLVGSDIQSEYWIAKHSMNSWDMSYPHLYNASISTALIAPWLSRVSHIDLVWIFKVVYPAIFAVVPVILFFAYRRLFGQTKALLATAFFVVMPVFFLEMPQLPRQMLAEVFLALMIYATVSQWKYKELVIQVCLLAMIFTHWTVGLMGVGIVSCVLVARIIPWIKGWRLEPIVMGIVMVSCLAIGLYWGSNVAHGLPMKGISNIVTVAEVATKAATGEYAEIQEYERINSGTNTYLEHQEPLVQTAIGLDLKGVSPLGIIFRIVQWLTQILILIGCAKVVIWWKRYKIQPEFAVGIFGSLAILGACVLVPNFSGLLGITRFYHLSLFFLAPMLVIGLDNIPRGEERC